MPVVIGARVRQLREKSGFSRADMAARLGITYAALSKYETGERTPDPDLLVRLADFFNVPLDYLYDRRYAVTTGSHLKPQTTLGDNVRLLRERSGLTRQQLAQAVHLDPNTVALWEDNRATPDAPTLRKLALALRCSVDFLLDLAPDMVPGVASGQQTSAGLDDDRAAKLAELDEEDRREIFQAIDTKWAEKRDPVFDKHPWLRRVPAGLLPDTIEAVKEGFVDGMFMRAEAGVTLDNLSDEGLRLFVEALVDYKRKNDEEKRRRGLLPKDENSQ